MMNNPKASPPPWPFLQKQAVRTTAVLFAIFLAACDGNKSEAGRRLGISRKTMDRKCQAWGI